MTPTVFSLEELRVGLIDAIAAARRDSGCRSGSRRMVPDHVRFTARLVPAGPGAAAGRFRFWSREQPTAAAVEVVVDWAPEAEAVAAIVTRPPAVPRSEGV
jgi:hypothetical protein